MTVIYINLMIPRLVLIESDDLMEAAFAFLIGKMVVIFISILLYFTFMSCLNIAAENQVNNINWYK